jgi:hypothetical protein
MVQRNGVYLPWGLYFNFMTYDDWACGRYIGIAICVKSRFIIYGLSLRMGC